MPTRDETYQWIELTDFTPGIFSNNNLAGGVQVTSTNVAMASPTNTFRCRSLPTGGLGPLPRLQESFGLTTVPDGGNGYTYYVHGLGTWGNISGTNTDLDHRIEVHLPVSYTTGGSFNNVFKWLRERIYDGTPTTETILTDTATDAVAERVVYAYLLKTRMNPSDPDASSSQPVMVCVFGNVGQGIRVTRAQPDPGAPTTNSTVILGPETAGYLIRKAVAHQGRIVFGQYITWDRGVATRLTTDENILWTDTNDSSLVSLDPATFIPEVDSSITDWSSMSANQLVVVKSIGGGYVLQGDLSDVTVVRLPNLTCPDGSDTVAGCNTGIGWVYSAGDNGMWVWNGGDASRPLSPQLDGRVFTEDNGVNFGEDSHRGQCDRWLDLLLAPNLWVCDLNREGWWRLDDPDSSAYPTPPVYFSSTKYHQQTIGARARFSDAENAADQVFYLYEYGDLAYSWSWQSHPLWISQDKSMTVRQGIAALQGHGTVTFTITDEAGNESQHPIDIDSDIIRNYRWDVSMTAENLTIRIEASGNAGDGPATSEAPLVHRAFFAWKEAQHLENANQ